jgi:hypothetical protein
MVRLPIVRYRGHYDALRAYNGSERIVNGVLAKDDYANTVMNNARASYGDGQ